ncbi:MAG: DUF488 domain-containing protein [Janthinobacterium lividum]
MARLLGHGVGLLVDVRAIAQSRKPGFSKTLLSATLQANGIGYLHLRGLGTPKPGRIAARAGNTPELHRIFAAHMATDPARHDLATLATVATQRRCCLFCFERDHATCHRTIVADMVAAETGVAVAHI